MKRLLTILSAAVLTAFTMTGQDKDTLKVMTYNLRFGELASMSDFAGFINSEKPDIVALQECDWATYRERAPKQHGVKFVNELAWRTGMFGLYGRSIDYKQGYYGIGILSKYPVVKSERIRLPDYNDKGGKKTEPRIMLLAEIELPSGRHVTFVWNTRIRARAREGFFRIRASMSGTGIRAISTSVIVQQQQRYPFFP